VTGLEVHSYFPAMNQDLRPILIAGPTASGKSALALGLAGSQPSIIINADSMQVYEDLRILTARPSEEDLALSPHALYGHVPGSEAYSAGRFAREVKAALAKAEEEGLRPIIAGGTGLYFRSLLTGLSPIPEIPAEIRAKWRKLAEEHDAPHLHRLLKDRDPAMAARLNETDPQRIVRALEVLEATGRSLSLWQQEQGEPVLNEEETVRFRISLDRSELHTRADARFDAMMAAGALEEVRALCAKNLDPALPVMGALGVKPLLQLISGEIDHETAVAAAKAQTRQFIKRQETWLRSNMISWNRILAQ
jgi:tRNA dimethylallyltransferase